MRDAKYKWDGEKIVQSFDAVENKISAKDLLTHLNNLHNQKNTNEQQKVQLTQQLAQVERNLEGIKRDQDDLGGLKEKCIELQKEKLKLYISQMSTEMKKKAQEEADVVINKDPNAYNDMHKKNLPYLHYQKLIATSDKVAKNISPQVVSEFLYDTPIFENPFK